jgi:hypothetical protein
MKKKISKSNFNIFREIRIPNNSISQNYKLPSLIMNKNKNSIKKYENLGISMSNSNLSKNNIFKMQLNPKITSSTNYNIRNSHTMEIQKSLDTSKISKGNKTPKVKL